jgi:hypothetical protein
MSQPAYIPPMSSLGRSITATQPYYAPPTFPQTNYVNSRSPLTSVQQTPSVVMSFDGMQGIRAGVVNSRNRMYGMRWLYARGGQLKKWFQMISTPTVQSTKFQPVEASTWFFMRNDNLYRCGFPRNLGWSEKVPTIPPEALGTAQWQMTPAPVYKRNVFTRRSFATAPSVPAKPYNG